MAARWLPRERGDGVAGLDPSPFASDADRHDVVAVGIGGLQHVQRGDARHLVLGRAAAEEHHQAYARPAGSVQWAQVNCKTPPMRFSATEIARAVGGTVRGDDVEVDGVTIDSRAVAGGELFVPIVAERDGHEFIRRRSPPARPRT